MNDKLIEALNAAANYIDALGGDSRSYRQALAASKQEPQAQAGEPEVVATVESTGEHNFPRLQWVSADHSFRVNIGDKLITLQSHREAIAKLQAEVDKWSDRAIKRTDDWLEAIAKKDAALDADITNLQAIKTTLERENERPNGAIADTIWHTPYETLFDFVDAAITQAKEARK